MKRITMLAYGLLCYVVFFATFLYAIGFIGNLIVPKSIDSVPTMSTGMALLVDLGLLALFAIQHSLMARPFFKRAWTRIVPVAAERSTYVLISSLALALLFALWQPVGGLVWDFQSALGQTVFYTVYALGWLLVLVATFAIDHFELFGLRQTWFYARGKEYTPPTFKQPLLYRIVRHPLYLGWFMVFWATPTMTVTHLFFATAVVLYTLIGIQLEERDLADAHPEYEDYKKQVPMVIPSPRRLFGNTASTAKAGAVS